MVAAKHLLIMETPGKRRHGNVQGSRGRLAGLIAAVVLSLTLAGGVVGYERLMPPAIEQAPSTFQLSPAASERELNLILEQNALPEITIDNAIPGLLPGPAKFHGEDH